MSVPALAFLLRKPPIRDLALPARVHVAADDDEPDPPDAAPRRVNMEDPTRERVVKFLRQRFPEGATCREVADELGLHVRCARFHLRRLTAERAIKATGDRPALFSLRWGAPDA